MTTETSFYPAVSAWVRACCCPVFAYRYPAGTCPRFSLFEKCMETTVQIELLDSHQPPGPLRLPEKCFALLWPTNSEAILTATGLIISLNPGQVVLLRPDHDARLALSPDAGWLLLFKDTILRRLIETYPEQALFELIYSPAVPSAQLSHTSLQAINYAAQILADRIPGPKTEELDWHLFSIILLHVREGRTTLQNGLGNEQQKQLLQLYQLLGENYRYQRTAIRYARQMGLSVKTLNHIAKTATNKTVTELVNERLLDDSKRLLADPKLPIKEIAYLLDFADMAQFSHFIKKHTGLTPTQFRERQTSGPPTSPGYPLGE